MAKLLTTPLYAEDPSVPGEGLAFLVGFYFSFRLIFTVVLVRMLGADPQSGSEFRIALGFVLVGFSWLWLLGSSPRSLTSLTRLPTLRWVCAYLIFSLASLLWGEAASPAISFAYWCGTACDLILVTLFLSTDRSSTYATAILRGFIVSTCVIAAVAWIMPAQYDLRLGDEAYFNSNSIANLAVMAIFFAQYLARRGHRLQGRIPTIFLAITVLRTLSKTTIAAFAVSEAYLIIRDRSMTVRRKLFVLFSVLAVVFLFWGLLAAYFDFYTSYGNESLTLTGRTAIWAYVAEHSLERPWFGHGFDSMWKVVPVFGTFEARHAENELLEQFYSYGIAGLVLGFAIYREFYRVVRRCTDSERIVFVAMLLYVLVRGMAEAEPFDLLMPLWAVALIAFVASECPAGAGTRAFQPKVRMAALESAARL